MVNAGVVHVHVVYVQDDDGVKLGVPAHFLQARTTN